MRKITKLYETIKEEELYAKNGAENSELLAGEQDSRKMKRSVFLQRRWK